MSEVLLTRRRKVVRFICHDVPARPGVAGKLFSALGEQKINIMHMYNTEHTEKVGDIIITVEESHSEKTLKVLEKVKDQIGASSISGQHNLAILTFDFEDCPFDSTLDSMSVAFSALTSAHIEVSHLSASEKRVFIVLPDDKAMKASFVLEQALKEGPIIHHI